VLEATVNRELMQAGVEMAASLGFEIPPDFAPSTIDHWYTAGEHITHSVDVGAQLAQKRAAMSAHASQATASDPGATRTLELFLRLPDDYFALAFGTEWFVELGRRPDDAVDDVFASVAAAS
jgi:LmbE family N-acetylglucosaminyl deacetylase